MLQRPGDAGMDPEHLLSHSGYPVSPIHTGAYLGYELMHV